MMRLFGSTISIKPKGSTPPSHNGNDNPVALTTTNITQTSNATITTTSSSSVTSHAIPSNLQQNNNINAPPLVQESLISTPAAQSTLILTSSSSPSPSQVEPKKVFKLWGKVLPKKESPVSVSSTSISPSTSPSASASTSAPASPSVCSPPLYQSHSPNPLTTRPNSAPNNNNFIQSPSVLDASPSSHSSLPPSPERYDLGDLTSNDDDWEDWDSSKKTTNTVKNKTSGNGTPAKKRGRPPNSSNTTITKAIVTTTTTTTTTNPTKKPKQSTKEGYKLRKKQEGVKKWKKINPEEIDDNNTTPPKRTSSNISDHENEPEREGSVEEEGEDNEDGEDDDEEEDKEVLKAKALSLAEQGGYSEAIAGHIDTAFDLQHKGNFRQRYIELQTVMLQSGFEHIKNYEELYKWYNKTRNNVRYNHSLRSKARMALIEACVGQPIDVNLYDIGWVANMEEFKRHVAANKMVPRKLRMWADLQEKMYGRGKLKGSRTQMWEEFINGNM